mmetsp:Transcript_28047/g.49455  ORF Transcript_28047/g.49455 Transcript_28047/m.49455 type:complete len:571 (+) Transcript_28047:98-1810(+)|eukprot:CAMPEP_0197526110 /NCGR_PEP_ID=MMETSP1318-20131121/16399_1 /TAXON_ID=552666 /ORGANISM="Partenskyella glossopodia, Strain RCC365" /LENGTH=570 /DNA_ID=CAMNT_0043080115 /DNA_START=22 /DNA_END=1734 /DNA_ORIENTATION=+
MPRRDSKLLRRDGLEFDENVWVNNVWKEEYGPHQVFVWIDVHQISEIDAVKHSVHCSFTVRMRWMPAESDFKDPEHSILDKLKDSNLLHWKPTLRFPSAHEAIQEAGACSLERYGVMMMLRQDVSVSGTFAELFELHSFPFDCQDVTLTLAWQDPGRVAMVWGSVFEKEFVRVDSENMGLTEYILHSPIAVFSHEREWETDRNFKRRLIKKPVLKLSLKLERVYYPYLIQVFMVYALIMLGAITAFFLDIEEGADRMNQATTMLLTIIAFQIVLSSTLPKLDYLTLADSYSSLAILQVGSIVFQIGFIAWLRSHWEVEYTIFEDKLLLLINFALIGILHICLFIYVKWKVLPYERAKLLRDPDANNELMREESSTQDVCLMCGTFSSRTTSNDKDLRIYSRKFESHRMSGLFESEYVPGHKEVFYVHVEQIANVNKLIILKVMGDANVPAGKKSVETVDEFPKIGQGEVKGTIQIRADPSDPNGFSKVPASVQIINEDLIKVRISEWRLTMVYDRIGESRVKRKEKGDSSSIAESGGQELDAFLDDNKKRTVAWVDKDEKAEQQRKDLDS